MKIHHIAIWTFHLEKLREFYTRYFNGTSNENTLIPKKVLNLTSFHLKVVLQLELMSRIDVQNIPIEETDRD